MAKQTNYKLVETSGAGNNCLVHSVALSYLFQLIYETDQKKHRAFTSPLWDFLVLPQVNLLLAAEGRDKVDNLYDLFHVNGESSVRFDLLGPGLILMGKALRHVIADAIPKYKKSIEESLHAFIEVDFLNYANKQAREERLKGYGCITRLYDQVLQQCPTDEAKQITLLHQLWNANKIFDQYAAAIRNDNGYMGETEMLVLSHALNINFVYVNARSHKEYQLGAGPQSNPEHGIVTIRACYNGRDHWSAVVAEEQLQAYATASQKIVPKRPLAQATNAAFNLADEKLQEPAPATQEAAAVAAPAPAPVQVVPAAPVAVSVSKGVENSPNAKQSVKAEPKQQLKLQQKVAQSYKELEDRRQKFFQCLGKFFQCLGKFFPEVMKAGGDIFGSKKSNPWLKFHEELAQAQSLIQAHLAGPEAILVAHRIIALIDAYQSSHSASAAKSACEAGRQFVKALETHLYNDEVSNNPSQVAPALFDASSVKVRRALETTIKKAPFPYRVSPVHAQYKAVHVVPDAVNGNAFKTVFGDIISSKTYVTCEASTYNDSVKSVVNKSRSAAATDEEAIFNYAQTEYIRHREYLSAQLQQHQGNPEKLKKLRQIEKTGLAIVLTKKVKTSLSDAEVIDLFKKAGFAKVAGVYAPAKNIAAVAKAEAQISPPILVASASNSEATSTSSATPSGSEAASPPVTPPLSESPNPFPGYVFIKPMSGGANGKGEHAGMYRREIDGKIVFIKRDTHKKSNEPRLQKVLGENLASLVINQNTQPGDSAVTSLLKSSCACKDCEKPNHATYLVSEGIDGYVADLWEFAYVLQYRNPFSKLDPKDWYDETLESVRDKIPKERPKFYESDKAFRAVINNALEFVKNSIGEAEFLKQFAEMMAASLLVGDFDVHTANLGVTYRDGKFRLARLDYGGALRNIKPAVDPEQYRPPIAPDYWNGKTQPTNHFKEFPLEYRVSSQMADAIENIARADAASLVLRQLDALKDQDGLFSYRALKKFYKHMHGVKHCPIKDRALLLECLKVDLGDLIRARQKSFLQYSFEMRVTLFLEAQTNPALGDPAQLWKHLEANYIKDILKAAISDEIKLCREDKKPQKIEALKMLKQSLGIPFSLWKLDNKHQYDLIKSLLDKHGLSNEPWASKWEDFTSKRLNKIEGNQKTAIQQMRVRAVSKEHDSVESRAITEAGLFRRADKTTATPYAAIPVQDTPSFSKFNTTPTPYTTIPDNVMASLSQLARKASTNKGFTFAPEVTIDFSEPPEVVQVALLRELFVAKKRELAGEPEFTGWHWAKGRFEFIDSQGIEHVIHLCQDIIYNGKTFRVNARAPEIDSALSILTKRRATLNLGRFNKASYSNVGFQLDENDNLIVLTEGSVFRNTLPGGNEAAAEHGYRMAAKVWGHEVTPKVRLETTNRYGEIVESFCFHIPYFSGVDLSDWIGCRSELNNFPPNAENLLRVAKAISKAYLDQIIAKGIIAHCDFSPRNIRLDCDRFGEIKVNIIDLDRAVSADEFQDGKMLSSMCDVYDLGSFPIGLLSTDFMIAYPREKPQSEVTNVTMDHFIQSDLLAMQNTLIQLLTGVNVEKIRNAFVKCFMSTNAYPLHISEETLIELKRVYPISPAQGQTWQACQQEVHTMLDGYKRELDGLARVPELVNLLNEMQQQSSFADLDEWFVAKEDQLLVVMAKYVHGSGAELEEKAAEESERRSITLASSAS